MDWIDAESILSETHEPQRVVFVKHRALKLLLGGGAKEATPRKPGALASAPRWKDGDEVRKDEFWCPIENPLKHCHKVVYLTVRPLTLQRQDWAV